MADRPSTPTPARSSIRRLPSFPLPTFLRRTSINGNNSGSQRVLSTSSSASNTLREFLRIPSPQRVQAQAEKTDEQTPSRSSRVARSSTASSFVAIPSRSVVTISRGKVLTRTSGERSSGSNGTSSTTATNTTTTSTTTTSSTGMTTKTERNGSEASETSDNCPPRRLNTPSSSAQSTTPLLISSAPPTAAATTTSNSNGDIDDKSDKDILAFHAMMLAPHPHPQTLEKLSRRPQPTPRRSSDDDHFISHLPVRSTSAASGSIKSDLRYVQDAMPVSYWAGRFTAQRDILREEEATQMENPGAIRAAAASFLNDTKFINKSSSSTSRAASRAGVRARAASREGVSEVERTKKALSVLEQFCDGPAARESFLEFQELLLKKPESNDEPAGGKKLWSRLRKRDRKV